MAMARVLSVGTGTLLRAGAESRRRMSGRVLLANARAGPLPRRGARRRGRDEGPACCNVLEERLPLADSIEEIAPLLGALCHDLGLDGLMLYRDQTILAQAGAVSTATPYRLRVAELAGAAVFLHAYPRRGAPPPTNLEQTIIALLGRQIGMLSTCQDLRRTLVETEQRAEELRRRLITGRRLERERLGQALHRGPLQDVVLLRRMLPEGSAERQVAAHLAATLREVLTESATAALRDLGLPGALRSYARYLAPAARLHDCTIEIELDDSLNMLDDDSAFALYQLAHEALANAVRHSGGRRVGVRLRHEEQAVTLEVRDDGHGLPADWERVRIDHRGLSDALAMLGTVQGSSACAQTAAAGGVLVRGQLPFRPRAGASGTPRQATIGVVIADDHPAVREGLRRILAEDARLQVVAEAGTGHEVLTLVLEHQPRLLLLDLDLPGRSGFDALRAIRAHVPHPPRTLILSALVSEEHARLARELDAAGFLCKTCDGATIREAIARILGGACVYAPQVRQLIREQTYSASGRFRRYSDGSPSLSAAEHMVLQHMVAGQTYEDIATQLGRSVGTVRSQVIKVCEKLGVNSRQQAVLKGLRLGILHLSDVGS